MKKKSFNTVDRLMSSSGAGASYTPQTGVNVTTLAEQWVIHDFTVKNPVWFLIQLLFIQI